MIRFFQHWRLLPKLQLWLPLVDFFFTFKHTCCAHQNLCVTFTNILGFLLNFSTSWKSCVKELRPKKTLFQHFWRTVMIYDSRPKREWHIKDWSQGHDLVLWTWELEVLKSELLNFDLVSFDSVFQGGVKWEWVEYIWVPKIMIDDWVHTGHTNLNMFSVFGEKFKSLSSIQSKLNFWNRLHPIIAFFGRLLTQTATWRPNCTAFI